jgi:hypothetical protein
MQGEIEGGAADESCQPGNRVSSSGISGLKKVGQHVFLEVVADFDGVASGFEPSPGLSKTVAQIEQRNLSFLEWKCARPNPLDAQRGFPPSIRDLTTFIGYTKTDAGTSDASNGLGSKL